MPPSPPDRAVLARMIDHTLLTPTATQADVMALCVEASALGVAAVCVSPSRLPLGRGLADGIGVAAVVGFPSGAHATDIKAHEADLAVEAGATEVDVVIDLGAAAAQDWTAVTADLAAVRVAISSSVLLKVIIEAAALADEGIERACIAAVAAGADMVKTSTGFHPAGGATVDAVRRMRAAVGPDVGVKASGGIRTAEFALALVEAGATRLGCSATAAILDGMG